MGMMGGLLCHFIDSPCMFKVSVAKRKLEMKFFFSVICISGISSFSDNAIYYLYNQSSPDLQLFFFLTFCTFSRPVNSQILVLLQR